MNPQQPSEPLIRITWSKIPFYLLVGIFVSIFSLNGLLKKIAGHWPDTVINQVLIGLSSIPDKLYSSLPGSQYFLFELLIRWLCLSIAVFLVLLLLNSVRLKSAAVLCSGVGGLSAGAFIFTWVSVALYLIVIVFSVISWILSWVSYLFKTVISAIIALLLWWPVLYGLIGLILLIGIIWLVSNFDGLREILIKFLQSNSTESLLKKLLVGVLGIGVLAGAVYLIVKVWQAYLKPLLEIIKNWFSYYIVPIISWIFWILMVAVAVILVVGFLLLTLLILGYQYCDQFISAKNCGRSTHKAFDTGFGLGVVIAVVLLICSTNPEYKTLVNAAWNSIMPLPSNDFIALLHSFMPHKAEILLQSLFVKASLPIFDVTSLIIAFFLANCSLVMSLTSGTVEEPLSDLFKKERMPVLFLLTFGALVVIATAAVDAVANQDD